MSTRHEIMARHLRIERASIPSLPIFTVEFFPTMCCLSSPAIAKKFRKNEDTPLSSNERSLSHAQRHLVADAGEKTRITDAYHAVACTAGQY